MLGIVKYKTCMIIRFKTIRTTLRTITLIVILIIITLYEGRDAHHASNQR